MQLLDWMERDAARSVLELVPATGAGCRNEGRASGPAHGWAKHEFADLLRE